MKEQQLFSTVEAYIRQLFAGESSGHDAEHTLRVYRTALRIQQEEGGDRLIVGLAALLHDADDRKLFNTADTLANARAFLSAQNIAPDTTEQICAAIRSVSFKGTDTQRPATLEGCIVQDADRLDAIGAIGIARAFAYGGAKGRAMHLPDQPPQLHMNAAQYAANQGTTINHFYEKLLLLENLMNTPTARRLAHARHLYMESFLSEFMDEWEGRR